MTGDELRQQIVQTAVAEPREDEWPIYTHVAKRIADALLPVVERYAQERAAEAWTEAADLALAAAQFDWVPPIVRQANRLMAESFRENATAVRAEASVADQGWKCPWCQSWNPSTSPRCSCCEIARDHRPASPQEPLPPEPFEPDTP